MGGSALWHCVQGKVLGQGLVRLMCKIGWSHIGAEEDSLCLPTSNPAVDCRHA